MKTLIRSIVAISLVLQVSAQTKEVPRLGAEMELLRKSATQIDQHIAAFYRKQKLPVPAVTDDATFLRRAFLVAIGRIPTAEEALAFIEIEDEAKREELVQYLMGSQGYSSHMTNWAFDLLRLRDGRQGS